MHWLYELAHAQRAGGKLLFAFIMVAAFLAVIGVLLLLIDRVPKRGREKVQGFLFLLPALVLLAIGLIGPIVKTLIQSLTSAEVSKQLCVPRPGHVCLIDKGGAWNDFGHYRWAFTNSDALAALANTLKWVLIAPITATLIGLAYAYAIDKIRGESLAKALVFLPTAISFVGAAVIWGLVYQQPSENGASGLLNALLNTVGLGPINFPTDSRYTTYWLIVIMIWIQAGFATVLLSAAIKGVPAELAEAAKIDGATGWQAFRRVIIPSIRPTIIVVLVTISIATLKIFDLIQTFGADRNGGDTLANLMYTTYKQAGLGQAAGPLGEHRSAALAMIIFLLVIPFVVFQVRQMVKQRAN